jgi:NTP pyrophosphatase (non-canonical NTP hydrolase)
MSQDIQTLTHALREFALARNWAQFHSPKNLSAALSVEAAELLEHFQWMTEAQSQNLDISKKAEVAAEAADVLLYLLQFCDKLDIDLIDAAHMKMGVNAVKHPVPEE